MKTLSGPIQLPASGKAPTSIVVFLHGLGADGANMIDLADELAGEFPDTLFAAPNAPFACDMAPMGYQWFSLRDWSEDAMLEGVQQAAPILNHYLDSLLAQHSLSADKLAVAGFSQGTMTALHTLPRRADAVAAIIGYSGALVGDYLLKSELQSKPPVCLIHGNADMVVPFGAMAAAKAALESADIDVETHARPMLGHGIDFEGIEIAAAFLKSRLG